MVRRCSEWYREKDPNALIIMSSDHGGFVGYDYTRHLRQTDDPDLVRFIFTRLSLAIKWPQMHKIMIKM